MAAVFIILFVTLILWFSKKRSSPFVPGALSRPARRLYTTIYGGGIEDRPRMTPDREAHRWVQSQPARKLKTVQRYLRWEISQLQPADWGGYMFSAVLRKSTDLFFFLDENGRLTLCGARYKELTGIHDAMGAVEHTPVHHPYTLRSFFHEMFQNIIMRTRQDDRYYGYGQLKVINLLRSYRVSIGRCAEPAVDHGDGEWSQLTVFARLAAHFQWLQDQRKMNMIDINRGFPIIEFDLARIDRMETFEHQGSLLNCLFLYLVDYVAKRIDMEPGYRSFSEPAYDMRAACFMYGFGEIYVVKYTGVTDEFPNRLYIEFANGQPRDPLYCDLLSKKLHLERDN